MCVYVMAVSSLWLVSRMTLRRHVVDVYVRVDGPFRFTWRRIDSIGLDWIGLVTVTVTYH